MKKGACGKRVPSKGAECAKALQEEVPVLGDLQVVWSSQRRSKYKAER